MLARATIVRPIVACTLASTVALLDGCAATRATPDTSQPSILTSPTAVAGSLQVRAACPNYASAMSASAYPRDAVARAIDEGKVVVRFTIDGSTVAIVSAVASDPAFVNAAVSIVNSFVCHVERPTEFEIPFTFRRT